jgi:endonuclease/exonuclease/phosphatase family metal-dependent hydrolase
LASSDDAASPAGAPTADVVVTTFNIHHGIGIGGRLDLGRTADVLAATGADVVGLQEVDRHWSGRSGFADQAVFLAERLGMHMTFAASRVRTRSQRAGPYGQYGNAVLSRFPLGESHTTPLPRPRGGEPRALLEAQVVVDGVVLRCLSTHLQHRSRAERLAQVETIKAVTAQANGPAVLLGDLNARPRSPEIRSLTEQLVDAWPGHGDGPGYTFRARAPFARIDYILTTPDIRVAHAGVVPTLASDHLPVSARLRVGWARAG